MLLWAFMPWLSRKPKSNARDAAFKRMEAIERAVERRVRAKYDAAQTTSDNRNHWVNADCLSARAANSPGVRQTLRNRARYEAANNSYCAGMLLTLANDTIGTGPRLRLHVAQPAIDLDAIEETKERLRAKKAFRRMVGQVEAEFNAWAREIKLAQKLRTMRLARSRDGEAFAVFTYNPKLRSRVKLDLKLVEADQVTSLNLIPNDPRAIDGIRFDEHMNPKEYDILGQHPGDDILVSNWQPTVHPAENVIHWFRADRPGQLRGIPEITPALPLYAQLRRYTLAVIAAAETAADFAAVITSKTPSSQDDDVAEPYTELDIVQRMLLQLPNGMELFQLKAEQPTTTYDMFKRELLNEIARCQQMPYNVAAGNSSGYNYSSGRLDHQIYFRSIDIDRSDCEVEVLERITRAWFDEAVLIDGLIPDEMGPVHLWTQAWSWDPPTDIDPTKTANARLIDLSCGMTSHQAEYDKLGLDWEVEQEKAAESLGCTVDELRDLLRQKILGNAASIQLANEQQSFAARMKRMGRKVRQLTARLRRAQMGA